VLHFQDAHFSFGNTAVIGGLDLEIGPGKLTVLLGRSGCGKTTALRLAAGLLMPSHGCVTNSFRRTAHVFQEPRLLPWATALDNAAFGLKALGFSLKARRDCAAHLLLRLGLEERDLLKTPAELSGGMAQRVAIARALAIKPDLVLMDEPFASLDAPLRAELQDMLRSEIEGGKLTALFVTHDAPEAVRLADRIVVLSPRPAYVAFSLANHAVSGQASIYAAAASLLQIPEVGSALRASGSN
jgi:NitT/TauT family transport system ATP-binding protein